MTTALVQLAGLLDKSTATQVTITGVSPTSVGAGELAVGGGDLWASGMLSAGASTTAKPSLHLTPGVAPTSPNDGDMWVTSSGLFVRINGVTQSAGGGGGYSMITQTGTDQLLIDGGSTTNPSHSALTVKSSFNTSGSGTGVLFDFNNSTHSYTSIQYLFSINNLNRTKFMVRDEGWLSVGDFVAPGPCTHGGSMVDIIGTWDTNSSTLGGFHLNVYSASAYDGSSYLMRLDFQNTPVFRIQPTGDVWPRNVSYTWPSSNAGGVLNNDGYGNLTWSPASGGISGSGSVNSIPLWTGSTALGNSILNQTSAADSLQVTIGSTTTSNPALWLRQSWNVSGGQGYGVLFDFNTNSYNYSYCPYALGINNKGGNVFSVSDKGFLSVGSATGSIIDGNDSRPFVKIIGQWNYAASAVYGIYFNLAVDTAHGAGSYLLALDYVGSHKFCVDTAGNALVRGVSYSWPTANSSGVLTNDGSGNLSWTALSSSVTGSGTVNTLPKFTTSTNIGDSSISDAGTTVVVASRNFQLWNAATAPSVDSNNIAEFVGESVGVLAVTQFNNSPGTAPGNIHKRARGTVASPAALAADDLICTFGGRVYHSGGAFSATSNVSIRMYAAEIPTAGAQGTYIDIQTTATGTTTSRSIARFNADGSFRLGTPSSIAGKLILNNASGANTVTLQTGTTATSYVLSFPTTVGSATTILQNDGSGNLTWVSSFAPTAHVLDSATHTISGKTAGQVLMATGATTYAFTSVSGDASMSGAGVLAVDRTDFHIQHGFNAASESTIAFDPVLRRFTITPTSSTFRVFKNGVHVDVTTKTVDLPSNTTGLYYITMNSDGTLAISTTVWNLFTDVPVASVYYYAPSVLASMNDERHTAIANRSWHQWGHTTIGTRYVSGLVGTFGNTTFSMTQGRVADEDIVFDTGGAKTNCRLWRYSAANSVMYFTEGVTTPYLVNAGTIQYDNAGTATNVPNNNYVINDVYGTTDPTYPIYIRIGDTVYGTLAAAQTALTSGTTTTWQNLPTAELKILYRIIYRNQGGTPTFIQSQDYRSVSSISGAASGTSIPIHASTHSGAGTDPIISLGSVTFTGEVITPASTTAASSLNVPHGAAPTAPVDGDVWTTTAGLYARINGTTVGPFGPGSVTGSISTNQVAVGSGTNAIAGSSSWTATTTSGALIRVFNAGTSTATTSFTFDSASYTASGSFTTSPVKGRAISFTVTGIASSAASFIGHESEVVISPTQSVGSATYIGARHSVTASIGANNYLNPATMIGTKTDVTFLNTTTGANVLNYMYGHQINLSATTGNTGGFSTITGLVINSTINMGASGSMSYYYGIYIPTPTVTGTIGSRYAIKSDDANSIVHIAGNIYPRGVTTVWPSANGSGVMTNDGSGNLSWAASATPSTHVLDSATHTISGKTAGQALIATGATSYAFTTIGGDATLGGTGTLTIAAAAVTLGKMANLAANSFIGNNTGSPATPVALTVTQAKTLLAISSSDVSGLTAWATKVYPTDATGFLYNNGSGTLSWSAAGGVTGSGTSGYLAMWSGTTAVGNATIIQISSGAFSVTAASTTVSSYFRMYDSTQVNSLLLRKYGSAAGAEYGMSNGGATLTSDCPLGIGTSSAVNLILGTNNTARVTIDGTTGTVTAANSIFTGGNIGFTNVAGTQVYLFTNETNTGTGSIILQAGAGSADYGGGICLFARAHATHPGDVWIGGSSASGDVLIGSGVVGGQTTYLKVARTGGQTTFYGSASTAPAANTVTISNGIIRAAGSIYAGDSIFCSNGTQVGFMTLGSGVYFGSQSNHSLIFRTNNTDRVTILNTGTMVLSASNASAAPLNIPQGTAPTSPNNGDMWTTSLGVYACIAGSVVGPFGAGGGGGYTYVNESIGTGTLSFSAPNSVNYNSLSIMNNAGYVWIYNGSGRLTVNCTGSDDCAQFIGGYSVNTPGSTQVNISNGNIWTGADITVGTTGSAFVYCQGIIGPSGSGGGGGRVYLYNPGVQFYDNSTLVATINNQGGTSGGMTIYGQYGVTPTYGQVSIGGGTITSYDYIKAGASGTASFYGNFLEGSYGTYGTTQLDLQNGMFYLRLGGSTYLSIVPDSGVGNPGAIILNGGNVTIGHYGDDLRVGEMSYLAISYAGDATMKCQGFTVASVSCSVHNNLGSVQNEIALMATIASGGVVRSTSSISLQIGSTTYLSVNGGEGVYLNGTNYYAPSGNSYCMSANGYFGVGRLQGSGNRAVYSQSDGTLTNTASDARLKTAVTDLTYGLDILLKLRPVSYKWLDEKRGKDVEIGFLAQDVQALVPEVVGSNSDTMLSLDYAKLTAVIVRGVQDLAAQVKTLTQQVADLTSRLVAVETAKA